MPRGPAEDGAAVRPEPLRWWQLGDVASLDADLFGAEAWSLENFWSELAAPQREYFVLLAGTPPAEGPAGTDDAADADRVVGYAGLAWSGSEADVQTIGVAAELQGRGWGRSLLRLLTDRAAAHGASALLLEVRVDNAAAIGLYESCGFERIAVRRGYYPGNVDADIMRLRPLPVADPLP